MNSNLSFTNERKERQSASCRSWRCHCHCCGGINGLQYLTAEAASAAALETLHLGQRTSCCLTAKSLQGLIQSLLTSRRRRPASARGSRKREQQKTAEKVAALETETRPARAGRRRADVHRKKTRCASQSAFFLSSRHRVSALLVT